MPHVTLDHALFVIIALVSPLIDLYWVYPRLRRATETGVPGARQRFYLGGALTQWGLTSGVLALWAWRGRPWAAMGLGAGSPLRLGLGFAFVAVVIGLLALQRRALFARPERFDLVLRQVGSAVPLLPHTAGERQGFTLLAITAGICEEVLYRGYVLWYVAVWTGPFIAAAISSVLFGVAHLYLDGRSAVRAGIVGALMAVLVLATGSLWPAMLLHAAIDMNSGDLAFRALSRARGGDASSGVPAAA
jgi:CAAX protease family protein